MRRTSAQRGRPATFADGSRSLHEKPTNRSLMLNDLDELRHVPRVSYYFRYRLHRCDFHELRVQDRLRGYYTAKPLYGRLTPEGRVDRSAGHNGDVAALFVPIEAQRVRDARLILTHIDPRRVTLATGRRNWPAIRKFAEHSIREMLAAPPAFEAIPALAFPRGSRGSIGGRVSLSCEH